MVHNSGGEFLTSWMIFLCCDAFCGMFFRAQTSRQFFFLSFSFSPNTVVAATGPSNWNELQTPARARGRARASLMQTIRFNCNVLVPAKLFRCELRTCRYFRGPRWGPAYCSTEAISILPRRCWGLRTAKLSRVLRDPGGPAYCRSMRV